MKKWIALFLSALMLVSVLAGCKDKTNGGAPGATDPTGDPGVAGPEFRKGGGVLYLNAGAGIRITYDAEGIALKVEALNLAATDWLDSCDDQVGNTCNEITSKFIRDIYGMNMRKLPYVLIKQDKDSGYPTETFMKDLKTLAENALSQIGSSAKLAVLSVDKLDSNGHLDLETAKTLALGFLGARNVENFVGADKPVNGYYSFLVRYDGMEEEVHVNALTGGVGQGMMDNGPQNPGDDPAEATDPKEPSATQPQG